MTPDQELIDALRNAIFLAALQLWEESCTWEELSGDGRHIYEEYAKAAADTATEHFALLVQRVDAASAELAAALNERDELRRSAAMGEAELVGLREQVRAMADQISTAIAEKGGAA